MVQHGDMRESSEASSTPTSAKIRSIDGNSLTENLVAAWCDRRTRKLPSGPRSDPRGRRVLACRFRRLGVEYFLYAEFWGLGDAANMGRIKYGQNFTVVITPQETNRVHSSFVFLANADAAIITKWASKIALRLLFVKHLQDFDQTSMEIGRKIKYLHLIKPIYEPFFSISQL